MSARAGSCALIALLGGAACLGVLLALVGGDLGAIAFLELEDRIDLDADTRLPRGGPGEVLMGPVPRLAAAGLAEPPLRERPWQGGWERAYRSELSQDGEIVLRLDAARALVKEVELRRPLPRYTLESLAARRAWGPPALNSGKPAAQVSRWDFKLPGGDTVAATVRWYGDRPGVLDAVVWSRGPSRAVSVGFRSVDGDRGS